MPVFLLSAEAESDAAIAAMMEEISMQEQEPVVIEGACSFCLLCYLPVTGQFVLIGTWG